MLHEIDEPRFFVGAVPVYGDVILAPMAGYADVPHRALCRAYGSAMHYTEFVPVEELISARRRDTRAWRLLDRLPDERPMVFQIFGNDPRKILDAAQRIESLEPDIIDINMGCSTRRVSGRGAGVGMMRTPDLIAETFALLTRHLSVPVTGKIRLGWDDLRNYVEVGRILEDNGCALIAIHPRTKEQKYSGQAKWDAIAALKQAVSVPVVGNGDVRTPEDIDQMLYQTGCDAVMIGRGAIGNPWLFARVDPAHVTLAARVDAVKRHAREMVAYHGSHGLKMFRKHIKRYLAPADGVDHLMTPLVTTGTLSSLEALLDEAAAVGRVPDGRTEPPLPTPITAC